jgi:transcriptional regulator with XRE-family HTH domain
MKPIDIRILLMRARKSQSQIARELEVTQGFVGQVILGLRHTQRVRMAIAEAVGKPIEKLWPSYTKVSEGKPNSKRKAA